MYWNYHYFKYVVMLFTLLGYHLFMLNKYHLSFGCFDWFILFTCMNILFFCHVNEFFFGNYDYYDIHIYIYIHISFSF